METLHHLLSFIYNPTTNTYNPIRVWENPKDPTDFLLTASLAGRRAREAVRPHRGDNEHRRRGERQVRAGCREVHLTPLLQLLQRPPPELLPWAPCDPGGGALPGWH